MTWKLMIEMSWPIREALVQKSPNPALGMTALSSEGNHTRSITAKRFNERRSR